MRETQHQRSPRDNYRPGRMSVCRACPLDAMLESIAVGCELLEDRLLLRLSKLETGGTVRQRMWSITRRVCRTWR